MRRIGIPGVESLGRRSVSSVSVSFTPVIEITITRGKIRRKDRKRGSTRSPPAIHPTTSFHPLRPPWVSSPPVLLSPPRKHVFVFVLRPTGWKGGFPTGVYLRLRSRAPGSQPRLAGLCRSVLLCRRAVSLSLVKTVKPLGFGHHAFLACRDPI